jgi:LAO/AO transport system kinase
MTSGDGSQLFGISVAPGSAPAAKRPERRPPRRELLAEDYAQGIRAGDRTVLARAISLVESSNEVHEHTAQRVIELVAPLAGRAMRIGITGMPGAGKSTLIERLGLMLTARGHRLAVLAIDPTSSVSGGSILGDKTRMSKLAAEPNAFIRPSPSGGALGGVARRTRETMLLCEAAGFDIVLVETMGVGQSETAVAEMTDFFLAVMIAGAGDELQGIKRGLLELVDLVAVNKADGGNEQRAALAASEYAAALHMTGRRDGGWSVPVLTCSAISGAGVEALWAATEARVIELRESGALERRRREQTLRWLRLLIHERLDRVLAGSRAAAIALQDAESRVLDGKASPVAEAVRVVDAFIAELRAAQG